MVVSRFQDSQDKKVALTLSFFVRPLRRFKTFWFLVWRTAGRYRWGFGYAGFRASASTVAKCTRGDLGRLLLSVTKRERPGAPRRGNGAHSAPALYPNRTTTPRDCVAKGDRPSSSTAVNADEPPRSSVNSSGGRDMRLSDTLASHPYIGGLYSEVGVATRGLRRRRTA